MLNSTRLRDAFNLSAEPANVRESYGRTTYGQGCLLARRLVEAGAKFVTVYFSNSIGGQSTESGGWDTHGFNNTRMYPIIEKYHLPITEQTLPTLLIDLDERGLLDSTLVVWMGEFGRTPKINENASRDHWPQLWSVLFAGGSHQINSAADAAKAIEPLVSNGFIAKLIFSIGVVGLGLLAVPVLAGSSSYAISEALGWREGLYRKFKRARGFYIVIILATLVGLAINFLGINPIQALIFTAVFNGVAAVPLLWMIARIGNNPAVMGEYKNKWLANLVVRLTFWIMLIAVLVLFFAIVIQH